MKITAFFTNGGTPATGLSATIDGWEVGGAQIITAQAMSEQAAGWYYYEFAGYDEAKSLVTMRRVANHNISQNRIVAMRIYTIVKTSNDWSNMITI